MVESIDSAIFVFLKSEPNRHQQWKRFAQSFVSCSSYCDESKFGLGSSRLSCETAFFVPLHNTELRCRLQIRKCGVKSLRAHLIHFRAGEQKTP
jgi:hypothetical protein